MASPVANCKPNGTTKHLCDESLALSAYQNPRDFVEAAVCHVRDLENGQMREVEVGGGKALLIKEHGEYRAISHKCPHYGAPLVKGVLSGGQVRCPWHGACFSIATGDIEDFPGLDSLEKFQSLESTAEQITLRSKEFFQKYDIELLKEKEVVTVDIKTKTAIFRDGLKMVYKNLLIATGSSPKLLNCKGTDVENVFYLRTPEDANCIAKLANNKNAIVVGASYVGMEVAAYLAEKAHSVSVVSQEDIPFRKALGEKVGRAIMKMFDNNRIKFYMLNDVSEFRGQQGKLKEVVLNSGKVLRADVCIIGTGVSPATSFLKHSGINMDSKGFIPVSKTMQTNVPGVFAAGDVVTFPLALRSNKKVNVPHWQMAHMHGHGEGFDSVIIQGDLDELKFVAFYTKSEEVIAVASMNYDPIVSKVAEVFGSGRTIRKRDVE
ncbi:UNVERIFIED_CONTAM: hypothetical protein FKN15_043695 [Acipenser sinensis]